MIALKVVSNLFFIGIVACAMTSRELQVCPALDGRAGWHGDSALGGNDLVLGEAGRH